VSVQRYLDRIELGKLSRAPFGVGAFFRGNVLLIGEQAARLNENTPEQQAFCDHRGCSGWINALLEKEGFPESKLFWLNALFNNGDRVHLSSFVKLMEPVKVIALGKVATQSCIDQQVEHISTYHPQYWKRFKSRQRYPLLDILKPILENIPDRGEVVKSIHEIYLAQQEVSKPDLINTPANPSRDGLHHS
jgi:hypothetical protein